MTTRIEVCNSALLNLGAEPISSFTEQTPEARICNAKWDIARRATLGEHQWNFALKRITLAQEVGAPVFGFDYMYPLPNDLLFLVQVYEDSDYKMEQKKVLTDRDTCIIKYVFDNIEVELWPPLFIDVMVARMSMELAYAIVRARSMIETQTQLYAQKLQQAKFVDSSEDIADPLGHFDDTLIAVRY